MALKHTSRQKVLGLLSVSLLVWLSVACDSGQISSSGEGLVSAEVDRASANSFLVEELRIDMLDQMEVEPFPREPSLGFALPPSGAIFARSTAVGTRRGAEFELSCNSGEVLAGVSGHVSNRIERIQPLCVAVDDNGRWQGSPTATNGQAGSNNGASITRQCATDSAVFGISSDFANDYPSYLQLHCRALLSSTESSGPSSSLAPVGALVGRATTPQCADMAVATGIYGHVQSQIERVGLVCHENPSFAGRWSSVVDWPLIGIHSAVLSDGRVLTYGSNAAGRQGALEYDVWDPEIGTAQQSHSFIPGVTDVDSFCGAAMLLPSSSNVLLPGGDARPQGSANAGIRNALMLDTASLSVSSVADMAYERWYTTSTMLPEGDVLLVGGHDSQRRRTAIPEVYSPATGQWRSLNNASIEGYGYFYPRQWVLSDGRVFAIAQHRMFFLDTEGEGALSDAGTLPAFAYGNSGTATMFAPDQIIYVGGTVYDGYGAALIDVTSGSPVVTKLDSLAQSRRTWASSVSLADGNVMVVGGSYLTNDAVTASLGTEVWSPQNKQWTQYSRTELPRLYHSTAVLLKDGRVLLAGGGAPGPLLNDNAELFSPPYLFDDDGSLAERPEIVFAPQAAAWGQSIGIRMVDNTAVSRITLVKTGSITHAFNMDQRFLELDFNVQQDSVSVSMPESANLATPGFYMMFVYDAQGTPSVASMLKLGDEAAPALPPLAPAPITPPLAAATLLDNGGFEAGKQSWQDCAAESLTAPANVSVEGAQSMKVTGGGCMFQVVSVQPGDSYSLSCEVRTTAFDFASLTLQMLDAGFAEVDSASLQIDTVDFSVYSALLDAPADAVYASVDLYSEGTAHFDRCELVVQTVTPTPSPLPTPQTPPPPPVPPPVVAENANSLLSNGGFEQGVDGWLECAQASLTNISSQAASGAAAMQIENAGCLYQEFSITPGTTYQMSCQAKSEASQFSSISLTLMDSSYTALDAELTPVGRNAFQTYQAEVFTPVTGSIGAITLYSEDRAQFDDCVVLEL